MTNVLILTDSTVWASAGAAHSLAFCLEETPEHAFTVAVEKRYPFRFVETDVQFDIVFLYCNFNTPSDTVKAYRQSNPSARLVCGVRGWMGYTRVCKALTDFDAVNTNNLVLLEALTKVHPNVHLCHAGVDTARFKPGPGLSFPSDFTVGWVGDKKHVKNGHLVERLGFPYVRATTPRLAQIGFGLYLPFVEMPKFYNGVDVLVNTSYQEGWPVAEGSPLPVLEAAACGKPVIVPKSAGAAAEFLDDEQVVAADFLGIGLDEMREKVQALSQDQALRERWGQRNRRVAVSEWDWRVKARNFARFLESVL